MTRHKKVRKILFWICHVYSNSVYSLCNYDTLRMWEWEGMGIALWEFRENIKLKIQTFHKQEWEWVHGNGRECEYQIIPASSRVHGFSTIDVESASWAYYWTDTISVCSLPFWCHTILLYPESLFVRGLGLGLYLCSSRPCKFQLFGILYEST